MQDARSNASKNGIDNATFVAMDLTMNMPKSETDLPRPDVVILGMSSRCICGVHRAALVHGHLGGQGTRGSPVSMRHTC